MPPDFPELAPTMGKKELMKHYHCGDIVLRRWYAECKIDRQGRLGPVPVPDDFAEMAKNHTHNELRRIYGRSSTTIYRWAKEANVQIKRVKRAPVKSDGKAEIARCLSCTKKVCHGQCRMIAGGG